VTGTHKAFLNIKVLHFMGFDTYYTLQVISRTMKIPKFEVFLHFAVLCVLGIYDPSSRVLNASISDYFFFIIQIHCSSTKS
jgi:hypothetical protein